ncbi:hypothetical protein Ddye_017308 [Dipteronia dyeriana]|uniref:Uncharacterized protein n=1 Tax=Dipteronia dyeriana TaxID=168575 RepID=A0AAD9U9B8_9ROSI|nr:hypothetical protein Ddye_017308 [Dipteronia dyeriana]
MVKAARVPALALTVLYIGFNIDGPVICKEQKSGGRKNPATRPLGMIVKVKPQAKKAKINESRVEKSSEVKKTDIDAEKSPEPVKTTNIGDTNKVDDVSKIGLVSYSDESEDDD